MTFASKTFTAVKKCKIIDFLTIPEHTLNILQVHPLFKILICQPNHILGTSGRFV